MRMKKGKKDQLERSEDAARALECDDDPEAFERVFAKVVTPTEGGDPAQASKRSSHAKPHE
jgi:hypothetical protein